MNEKKYGLIGYPLGHSMSVLIHKELFKISSIKAEYQLIEIKSQELEPDFKNKLKNLNGFNTYCLC